MLVLLVSFVFQLLAELLILSRSIDDNADHTYFYDLASKVKSQRSYSGFFQTLKISKQRASNANFEILPS